MKYSTRQKLIPWCCVLVVLRPRYINVGKLTIAQGKLKHMQPEIKKQMAQLSLITTVGGSQPVLSIRNLQNNFCQAGISLKYSSGAG